ncbi:MAG: hypothetical protein ACR2QJ_07000 [Geminicoccaceae bacterium]
MALAPDGDDQNGLDCVHAVLCLVEDDRRFGFELLLCDLHAVDPVIFLHFGADLCLRVAEGGEAVHELCVSIAGLAHHLAGHLIWREQGDSLLPGGVRLAYRDPDVGIDEVDAVDRRVGAFGNRDRRPCCPLFRVRGRPDRLPAIVTSVWQVGYPC